MDEFSSAVAAARNLEEPARPPQTPATEGPPAPPKSAEHDSASSPCVGKKPSTEVALVLSAGANPAAECDPSTKYAQLPWPDPAAILKWRVPMCKPQFENLPFDFSRNPFWLFCVWQYKERAGSDKPAKIPFDPKTATPAKVSDINTFGTLAEAITAYNAGGYDGIGVLLTGRLAALDVDNCIDDNGNLSALAEDVVKRINSYTEVSPSGRGLRILFLVPPDFHFNSSRYYINNHESGLEAYAACSTAKYVSLTGWTLVSGGNLEERDKEFIEVLERYMVRSQPQATTSTPAAPPAAGDAPQLTTADIRLIEDIQRSPSGEAFMALGRGDMSAYDNDHSAADMAFCNMVAAYTTDAAQIDRIFRNTKLVRPKWDSQRGDSTYGWNTIQRAIAGAQSYREQNQMAQIEQAAAQSATLTPTQAAIAPAAPVPIQEASQESTQAPDLAALQTAACVSAVAAPQPQGMQMLTAEEILEKQKRQRQQELLVKYPIIQAQVLSMKNLPPVQYFVKDMLPEGTLILAAKSKIGKSWLCLDLGIRIAAGEPFMGKATNQCGVLCMALEDSENRLQSRMKRVLRGKLPPPDFYFMTDAPTLDNGLLDVLDVQLDRHPTIKLVIVDTLARIRGESKSRDGAYAADYREMGKLQTYFRKKGVSVMFVTHLRKMDDDDVFNMINGSTGLMGAADNIWIISKKYRADETATLHMTGRELCQNELVISFNKDTCVWELVGSKDEVAEEEKRTEYENNPVVQAIKALVDGSETGTWCGSSADIIKYMGDSGKVLSSQEVAKEILKYQDLLLEYDCINYRPANTKSTGGRRHRFYVKNDTEDSEFVENPFSDDLKDGTDTSTDTQPAE